MAAVTCGSCGTQNPDASPVCAKCGQKLGSYKPTLVGERPSMTASGSGARTTPSKAEAALVGETIANRYVIQEMLGRGGVGVVYRATDRVLGEEIAIKLLHPEPNRDPRELERFKREVLTAKKITHPNVVRIDYFGYVDEAEQEAFLAMELLRGGSLARTISRGTISLRDAATIAIGICDGLEAAHRKDIVHRDIKPDNVLFDETGTPKLVDFGLARLANSSTRTHGFSGTPFYMAPEQADGAEATAQSDVYSLGVLLFELFTGRLPFLSDSLVRLVMQHTKELPPSPRTIRKDLPPDVEQIILQALAKDPRRRQQSAAEIATAFRDVQAGRARAEDATAIRPSPFGGNDGNEPTAAKPGSKGAPRRGWLLGLAGLGLAGVAGAVAIAVSQSGPGPAPTPTPIAIATAPDSTPAEVMTPPPTPVVAKTATPRKTATPIVVKTATPAPTRVALAKTVPLGVGTDKECGVWVSAGGKRMESPVEAAENAITLGPGTHRIRFERFSRGACPFDAKQPAVGCTRESDTVATCTVTVTDATTLVKYHVVKGGTQTAIIQRHK